MRLAVPITAVLALLAALVVGAGPAGADPPVNPSDTQITTATQARQALAAQLGGLQAQAASLQAQIDALQASADAAIARYEKTTSDVAAAVDAADHARADLGTATGRVATARTVVQTLARDAYESNSPLSKASALLFSPHPSDVDFTVTASNYLATRRDKALADLQLATVAASNAESARRGALALAEQLQQQADAERALAISALQASQVQQQQLAATLAQVNDQAATASAQLSGLLDQRAAYDAYQADLAAKEAARQATARAAALAAAAAAGASGSGGGVTATGGGTVGGTAPPPIAGGSWTRPLTSYTISSCYCMRWGVFHRGVDLAAPLGTPIYSVGVGTVIAAGPASGFGNWVVVDHHDGTVSIYGHMRYLNTHAGAQVGPGTLIAWVGAEGQATGPHLHFEIRIGGPNGPSTDPVLWLLRRGVTL